MTATLIDGIDGPAIVTTGHVCGNPHAILSPQRCCTPDTCDGTSVCRAPVHIHGCFADYGTAACTAPEHHDRTIPGMTRFR